MIDLQG